MFSDDIKLLAKNLSEKLRQKKQILVTAESCTGGLIAGCITDLAGSSDIFDRGFVTYSNDAKETSINVKHETITKHGAVSEETALEMAQGALKHSIATIAVSVTGIAGPGGGSDEKPVGLVYIGIATPKKTFSIKNIFDGNREQIRTQTVEKALNLLINELDSYDV